jgi:Holliday junction resolvase
MTGAYERELREVLSGTEKGVNMVTRSCTADEKNRMGCVIQRPFLVVRAAGSGMEGSGDLVAMRGDCSFPIEVKTTKGLKKYFSGRTKIQLEAMIREGERTGLMPLYAHRLKGARGDSWRIFRVETRGLSGTLRRLESLIPSFPLTRNGTPFMDWEQGMPLNEFLAMMCSPEGKVEPTFDAVQARAKQVAVKEKSREPSSSDILAELQRRRTSALSQFTDRV